MKRVLYTEKLYVHNLSRGSKEGVLPFQAKTVECCTFGHVRTRYGKICVLERPYKTRIPSGFGRLFTLSSLLLFSSSGPALRGVCASGVSGVSSAKKSIRNHTHARRVRGVDRGGQTKTEIRLFGLAVFNRALTPTITTPIAVYVDVHACVNVTSRER